ncbi:MAG TPA: ABC transporter permease [Spirochaetia bacterium]|nr:ABC transporter permease [Spirochaetia bacterium]
MVETDSGEKKKNIIVQLFEIREIGAILPLIILVIISSIINSSFYSLDNILNILRSTAYLFIPAVGMTFVLCASGIDLSVGSSMGLSGVMLGMLMVWFKVPVIPSVIITLIVGACAGAVNGLLITTLKFPPFIATLATYYSYRGLVMGVTKGGPISPMPESFNRFGLATILGIPNIVVFMVFLLIVGEFVLTKTKYGRYVLATGGNEESARLAGINTSKIVFANYVIVGFLSFVSGLFFSARFTSAQPSLGTGYELRIITACIIGGVSLFGGAGSMIGTFFGSLFMIVLENGMTMARISGYWKQAILGVIIVIAVIIDLIRKKELFAKK